MNKWFAAWIVLTLTVMWWAAWNDPLYPGINWMGATYLMLHHLVAVGTADFFAAWLFLLFPPLVVSVIMREVRNRRKQ